MEESQSKAGAPAPFLTKTYEMVDDPQTNYLVSWSDTGCSFIVWNPPEFCKELLPLYFKHNNFSSFVRQLNTYGFRKIDPDQWEFGNEDFLRGKKHLLNNIYRRKPIHSHSSVQTLASADSEKRAYEEEINRLQQENSFLHAQLKNHDTPGGSSAEIHLLRKQLQEMETRQTQLVALLGELMEKHEFGPALIEESDRVRGKRRRLLELDQTLEEDSEEEEENSSSPLDLNSVEKLGSSLNFWNSFIHGVSQRMMNKEEDNNGETILGCQRNMNTETWSPASSKENQSLPEFSPTTSSVYNNNNNNNNTEEEEEEDNGGPTKCSIIDVNLEPTSNNNNAADVELVLKEDQTEAAPEMNDVFWGQFLTEAPRPSDDSSQEVQSERRDTNTVTEHGKSWWNPHYVTWFG